MRLILETWRYIWQASILLVSDIVENQQASIRTYKLYTNVLVDTQNQIKVGKKQNIQYDLHSTILNLTPLKITNTKP